MRISVLANTGLGGTEKAATIYAANLVRRGYAVDYLGDRGPREGYLKDHGVELIQIARSSDALCAYIKKTAPQIIHQHVPGYPFNNPLYVALAQIESDIRPRVIETNVFGRLEDPESEQFVDFRLFITMASAAQAFRRAGLEPNAEILERQTVLYYPVTPASVTTSSIDNATRRKTRQELDVQENEILAVRIGRPGHKWSSWECQAYSLARATSPRLRLLLMEPPQKLAGKIAKGRFGTGIIVRTETNDFEWLERLYASADLMIHASDWGESFGYTIAEGMAAELPVITRSTPWCDNAQVELVENHKTGFVCWSVPEMARRLVDLTQDETMRRAMGLEASNKILSLANLENEIDLLEAVIARCLDNKTSSKLEARNAQLLGFVTKFPALEQNTSECLSDHSIDHMRASTYAYYRKSRAHLRSLLNQWQRSSS